VNLTRSRVTGNIRRVALELKRSARCIACTQTGALGKRQIQDLIKLTNATSPSRVAAATRALRAWVGGEEKPDGVGGCDGRKAGVVRARGRDSTIVLPKAGAPRDTRSVIEIVDARVNLALATAPHVVPVIQVIIKAEVAVVSACPRVTESRHWMQSVLRN